MKKNLPSSLKIKINNDHEMNKVMSFYERKEFSNNPNHINSLLKFIIKKQNINVDLLK
ncbi:hypothetical protein ALNOE001_17080 [Candidatus Methanobinarius endosymbioticus]|uniref:Uncharacterized protein n=1 Tax=Candidatus Methanobinarius endosymbioticus TaxID=2006182 RepID=A0A366M9C1_9EURY|nr:hypothetical protein ALNOE001_17080 [Candidatus Methanobinarius endosymbioticus]